MSASSSKERPPITHRHYSAQYSHLLTIKRWGHTPTLDEDEEAEREQLRAAAVQSVGFDVNISRPPVDCEHAFGDHGGGDVNTRDAVKTAGLACPITCPFKLLAGPGGMCQRKQEWGGECKGKDSVLP
jgi:hypothetical protein